MVLEIRAALWTCIFSEKKSKIDFLKKKFFFCNFVIFDTFNLQFGMFFLFDSDMFLFFTSYLKLVSFLHLRLL